MSPKDANQTESKIRNWLSDSSHGNTLREHLVRSIEKYAAYDKISIRTNKYGERTIAIPISSEINSLLITDKKAQAYLFIVETTEDKTKSAAIITYLPEGSAKINEASIHNVMYAGPVEASGVYSIFNLKGRLSCKLGFKDSKMTMRAHVWRSDEISQDEELLAKAKKIKKGRIKGQDNKVAACTEYYLVTTTLWTDGTTITEVEYLATICDDEDAGDGGGSGGGNAEEPDEPEIEIHIQGSFSEEGTDFTDDDFGSLEGLGSGGDTGGGVGTIDDSPNPGH
ncbi:hypothetical protein [Pedobacter sp. SYP-B3415]|uniref:hypothetical protein n=1 Tax=Pedobacter sp. SYP-B3415 TaxID=2496641 RepID=UPI00101BBE19|nr:hypothetical protein [Pedobacter sp. SYP-B3415]